MAPGTFPAAMAGCAPATGHSYEQRPRGQATEPEGEEGTATSPTTAGAV